MTPRRLRSGPSLRAARHRLVLAAGTVLALVLLCLGALPAGSQAADSRPCDIYAAAGTPCVAAHSTVRALFAGYNGPLYQVTRASDGATRDIGLLAAGGYADAAAQDSFCTSTGCTITRIYDQSSRHNDLTVEPAGTAGAADRPAQATALPLVAGGHKVYGVLVTPGIGYRHTDAAGVAVGGRPESMYMVTSGTHVNGGCCFDYGNAEHTVSDTGNGHMDAVYIGTRCHNPPCTGAGPWVAADLENGLYQGSGNNPANRGNATPFVTALLKNNGQTAFALKGGDARAGNLSTWWNGALPSGGYTPMQLEGSIVMGTGGDNSNASAGSFYEGVMTAGYSTDAADAAVQADIVAAGYTGGSDGSSGRVIGAPGGTCVDVAGDDVGVDHAAVQLWQCQPAAVDQHWTHSADNSLRTLGRCLDIMGNATAAGTKVQLWDCDGVGGQKWVQQPDGSLLNPQSGRCLDDPSGATANGTRLQIWDCNGSPAQQFTLT
ncbi:arabinofuranosidase catalytic domain-containing protein [Actinacidiphila paucisporea]|uniref:Ricin-type beta-trefoil lectin domain-containing protein n=1 Tax=Actinacidiphila paucisporea TaxID=310782 RepID=A0A1M7PEN5_9ACTN|nr:arabinofuranosidase catalytic domain-containing protein [Actinacidiphila paucisporea]SHN15514.1 Ricin-type beta-trefoil lectin domain-containing protein [Actinacidiphila paucisporea]